jgi:phosphoribosylglycinamide formyltransferase-1
MMKNIGVVASSGGSAIFALLPYIRAHDAELIVATDRPCGIEEKCAMHGVIHQRFHYHDKVAFSQAVADFFLSKHVDIVLLYYLRLVGQPLHTRFPTINFHPSLLPEFRGLNALARARKANSEFVGATAHIVDETMDGGPIIAQLSTARKNLSHSDKKTSYQQKLVLTLAVLDSFFAGESIEELQRRANGGRPAFLLPASQAFFANIEANAL